MGICYSRIERQEAVARCKARRRYMKQLVKARRAFLETHTSYLQSLRATGAALIEFASAQSHLCFQHHLPPCPPSPTPTLSISSGSNSLISPSPGASLPSPAPPSSWNFWDPFSSHPSRTAAGEEAKATTTASEAPATPAAEDAAAKAPSVGNEHTKNTASEPAADVSFDRIDLAEIIKEIDEHFVKAADAGNNISMILGAPTSVNPNQKTTNKVHNCSRSWNPLIRPCGFGSLGEEMKGGNGGSVNRSHCSTIERLYSWEKKLHHGVKNAESLKIDHEKKMAQLKKQEAKGADHVKIEKNKKEIEKLESRMMVSSQAIETISEEIICLREEELYPQLLELFKGLIDMWRSMHAHHQIQNRAVQKLKFLQSSVLVTEPTSKVQFRSTQQLELEVQQWHSTFCSLIDSQREYIHSLTGWLRLSLFQLNHHHHSPSKSQQNSSIYSLSEEWEVALDRIPDKMASEGIRSFLMAIHAMVLQQAEERKQKKRSEAACKELSEKVAELQSLECKIGPQSTTENLGSGKPQSTVQKRAEVDRLRSKAKEEKMKHEKCMNMVMVMTLNTLKTEFPDMFKSITSFSSVCMETFESVHNKLKSSDQGHDFKDLSV